MAMDSYLYYPTFDYSILGSMDYNSSFPPPNPNPDFLDSSIFDTEEDQQLILDLLSDYNLDPPNLYLESTNPNSISPVSYDPSYYNYPNSDNYQPFQLDFDYPTLDFPSLPSVQEQLPKFELQNEYYFDEPAPKRRKCSYNYEFLAPPPPPPPPSPPQPCVCRNHVVNGGVESTKMFHKGKASGARATTQSIAARERRKKISDKTQELGKLVPGVASSKMNTAEMLQHAYSYVRFLQAQVSVLELSESSKEDGKEEIKKENLAIVGSSVVQEKLFMKDMCLVPMDFVEKLGENEDLKSQGLISKELKQLMESVCVENC